MPAPAPCAHRKWASWARRPGGQEFDHAARSALPGVLLGPQGRPGSGVCPISRCRPGPTRSLYVAGRGVTSQRVKIDLALDISAGLFFGPARVCQTRNKRGLFIELGLEHNVNIVRSVMRPSVPRGPVLLPVLRCVYPQFTTL